MIGSGKEKLPPPASMRLSGQKCLKKRVDAGVLIYYCHPVFF
jgi:hypothetical protein